MKKRFLNLNSKFILIFLLFFATLISSICATSYNKFKKILIEEYQGKATRACTTVANFIDGDEVERYKQTLETDERYFEIAEQFCKVTADLGVTSLYIQSPISDTEIIFIYSFLPNELEKACSIGTVVVDDDGLYDANRSCLETGESMIPEVVNSEFGWATCGSAPIFNSSGQAIAWIGADIDMNIVMNEINEFLKFIIIISIAIVGVCLTVLLLAMNRVVIKPIKKIAATAKNFVDTSADSVIEVKMVELKSHDEIRTLADSINKMMIDVKEYSSNFAIATADREAINAELGVASRIQKSMLPHIFPAFPEKPQIDIYANILPATQVGGDFYDFFLIDEDHIGVLIADVTGKDLPAALFMIMAQVLIRNYAKLGIPIDEVFKVTNLQLCERNEYDLFITAFMGVIELSTGRFSYCNAGHVSPMIFKRNGTFHRLKNQTSFVLGGMEQVSYQVESILLGPGDLIFMYTDGASEATNSQGERFSESILLDVINEIPRSRICPEAAVTHVLEYIREFTQGGDRSEDIAAVSFEYKGAQT